MRTFNNLKKFKKTSIAVILFFLLLFYAAITGDGETQRMETSDIIISFLILFIVFFFIYCLPINIYLNIKEKKRKEKNFKKFLSENLGARLIHEHNELLKKQASNKLISEWNKKNLKYLPKIKKHILKETKSIEIKKNYNECIKKINELESRIKKENKMFADIFKRHPFVDEIIKSRSVK